jgi:GTPase
LFATLDARVARVHSRELADSVVIDTVGFVRKLPTTLVASFRSTLAEIREADLVLHVLDLSSSRVEEERQVALDVLSELGVDPDRILTVWNKVDLAPGSAPFGGVAVSASSGEGLDRLKAEIFRRRNQGLRGLVQARFGEPPGGQAEAPEKTKGGTVKLPPVPELPRRRSS